MIEAGSSTNQQEWWVEHECKEIGENVVESILGTKVANKRNLTI